MTRIVVAFIKEELQRKTQRLLASEGLEIAAVCASGAEVIRTVRQMGSAAVICGFRLRGMTADVLAADLRGLAAVMAVAKASYLELCGGENLFKLPVPASRAEFIATLNLMLDFEAAGGGAAGDPPGQGAADGRQPHDRGGGPPLPAKAQHGAGYPDGGGRPMGDRLLYPVKIRLKRSVSYDIYLTTVSSPV